MAENTTKLPLPRFARSTVRESAEARYWRSYRFPLLVTNSAAVTHIEFSQTVPHEFAVTCGTRVQIYDPVSNEVSKTVSRFKETVYSGTFRRDGRLLAACVGKQVSVVNMSTRTILRQLRGHEALATCVRFNESAGQLVSGSNDRTVRVWDVATEQEVSVLRGHEDYVLGLAGMPAAHSSSDSTAGGAQSQYLWASVSADRTCRLWDLRAPPDRAQMVLKHDRRLVRAALFTEDARLLCTGGEGGLVRVWDLMAGGRVQTDLVAHQKDVTALQLHKDPSSGRTRLLSAGLDHHVKVYDMSSHRVAHTIKYPSQIMSFALSPAGSHLVVGMADGLLSIRQRTSPEESEAEFDGFGFSAEKRRGRPRPGSYRYLIRAPKDIGDDDDVDTVDGGRTRKKPNLTAYEAMLRKFRYAEALDAALQTRQPRIIFAVLQELARRNRGMQIALSGRDPERLMPVLNWAIDQVTNPRYADMVTHVTHELLDIYAKIMGRSPQVDDLFQRLRERIESELRFEQELVALQGSLEMIMSNGESVQ